MSDFQINDYILSEECKRIAVEAIEETRRYGSTDESDSDEFLNECRDYVAQAIDGHEFVIYNYKALKICAECNTNSGEAFLEDIGMPNEPTIYSIASIIVYGEMESRAFDALEEALEPADA